VASDVIDRAASVPSRGRRGAQCPATGIHERHDLGGSWMMGAATQTRAASAVAEDRIERSGCPDAGHKGNSDDEDGPKSQISVEGTRDSRRPHTSCGRHDTCWGTKRPPNASNH
jgi:hypothetical protein